MVSCGELEDASEFVSWTVAKLTISFALSMTHEDDELLPPTDRSSVSYATIAN